MRSHPFFMIAASPESPFCSNGESGADRGEAATGALTTSRPPPVGRSILTPRTPSTRLPARPVIAAGPFFVVSGPAERSRSGNLNRAGSPMPSNAPSRETQVKRSPYPSGPRAPSPFQASAERTRCDCGEQLPWLLRLVRGPDVIGPRPPPRRRHADEHSRWGGVAEQIGLPQCDRVPRGLSWAARVANPILTRQSRAIRCHRAQPPRPLLIGWQRAAVDFWAFDAAPAGRKRVLLRLVASS